MITEAQKRASKKWYRKNATRVKNLVGIWAKAHPKHILLTKAKIRAKEDNLEFNLELEDIQIPEYCPYTQIKLKQGEGKIIDTSPSLDRIDNTKGYIKGNVEVISYLANRAKSNMSISQLKLFAKIILEKYAEDIT